LADEETRENGSEPPAGEEQQQETHRVRPLFRFRRNKEEPEQTPPPEEPVEDEKVHDDGEDQSSHSRVRPVRVVKFVPSSDPGTSEQDMEKVPFEATEEILEEDMDAVFGEVEEETPTTEAEEVTEVEASFEEAEEVAEVEAPFAEAEEVAEVVVPFAEAEQVVEEEMFSPLEPVPQEDPSFEAVEGTVEEPDIFEAVSEERSNIVDEEVGDGSAFLEETAEDNPFTFSETVEKVPEVPFAVIEKADREDIGFESLSEEEEPEVGEDLEFRHEETPVRFQSEDRSIASGQPISKGYIDQTGVPGGTPNDGGVSKPHYHKYLKPDEDILQRSPTRGRPSGFDRDLESEAEEIDFGIELIDPNELKKKKAPKKGPKESVRPAKGSIGGHDSDGEVGTRELGVDIGVDYDKRRKRRL